MKRHEGNTMKAKSLFSLSTIVLATLLSVSAPSSTAHALDGKVYPATLCWSVDALNGPIFHHWRGLAVNYSGGFADTWCPIITDHESGPRGLGRMRVIVNESTTGFSAGGTFCEVHAYDLAGNLVSFDAATVSGSGERTLDMTISNSSANAVYALNCFVSVGSWLNEYEVEERP